jgi:hypothetical protein
MCRRCSSAWAKAGDDRGARIGFDPALPTSVMIALGVLALVSLGVYVWRGGGAPILRFAGLAFVFLGLTQPQWVRETREPANDVALIVVDQSESLALAGPARRRARGGRRNGRALGARKRA